MSDLPLWGKTAILIAPRCPRSRPQTQVAHTGEEAATWN